MSYFSKLRGTLDTIFQIGLQGPQVKANGPTRVQLRNDADSAFAAVDVADGDSVEAATTRRQLISQVLSGGPTGGYVSGSYSEILPLGSLFPTSRIWWTSSAKTSKIIEVTTTYSGILETTVVYEVYENDGATVLAGNTFTDTVSYSGVFETTRTRVAT